MKMNHLGIRGSFLGLVLTLSLAAAFGQIPNPVLNVQDSPSDTAVQPLVLVQGGSTSSTLGVEVASQSTGTTNGNPLTTLGGIMQTGFGGLSLVQLGSSTSTGQGSPFFSMCAQQLISGSTTPQCWSWQVLGSGTVDILNVTRTNTIGNFTLQVPSGLNFAALGQLTIGSVPSSTTSLLSLPVTVVGGFTKSSAATAAAGPLQLFPGFLNYTSPASGSVEGALQIGMAVMGTPTMSNEFLLACYTTTAQLAAPCSTVTSPLLGVYLTTFADCPGTNCGTGGSSAVITPLDARRSSPRSERPGRLAHRSAAIPIIPATLSLQRRAPVR